MFRPTIQIDWYATWPFPVRSWPGPEVYFEHDLLRSNYSSFHTFRKGSTMLAKWMSTVVSLLNQNLLPKNIFHKKGSIFRVFALYRPNLRSNLWTASQKSVIRDIECAFQWHCSTSGSRVMCRFVEKYWKDIDNIWPWWPLLTWFWLYPKKWLKQFRHDFLRSSECRLPRFAR